MDSTLSMTPNKFLPSKASAFRPSGRRYLRQVLVTPNRHQKLIGMRPPRDQERQGSVIATKKRAFCDELGPFKGFRPINEDLLSKRSPFSSSYSSSTTLHLQNKRPRIYSICHSFEYSCNVGKGAQVHANDVDNVDDDEHEFSSLKLTSMDNRVQSFRVPLTEQEPPTFFTPEKAAPALCT
jgi:hypothetical protein